MKVTNSQEIFDFTKPINKIAKLSGDHIIFSDKMSQSYYINSDSFKSFFKPVCNKYFIEKDLFNLELSSDLLKYSTFSKNNLYFSNQDLQALVKMNVLFNKLADEKELNTFFNSDEIKSAFSNKIHFSSQLSMLNEANRKIYDEYDKRCRKLFTKVVKVLMRFKSNEKHLDQIDTLKLQAEQAKFNRKFDEMLKEI